MFKVELVPVVCWGDDEEAKVFEADVTISFPSGLTIVLLEEDSCFLTFARCR